MIWTTKDKEPTYKIRFKIFRPEWEWRERGPHSCNVCISPEVQINDWLKSNPNIEVISWQTCPVGTTNELYITIQYRDFEED